MIPSSRLAGPMAWMYHHSNTIPKEEYVSNEKEQRMKSVTLLLDKSLSETKNHNTSYMIEATRNVRLERWHKPQRKDIES